MIKEKKQKNTKRGFSILELVIAMFVLVVGILGALQLIVSTIRTSSDTRNSVIASGLAQEGVELARNIRDNNMLLVLSNLSLDRETTFSSHGFPVYPNNYSCIFNYNYNYASPTTCSSDASDNISKIYLTPAGYYTHSSSGNTETIFRRNIKFDYDVTGDAFLNKSPVGVTIISSVWWGSASKPNPCNQAKKCIEVKDYLSKRD